MTAAEIFHPEYDLDVEKAISVFYGRSYNTESEFIDSCQVLVDTGVWLIDPIIGQTCLFLLEVGNLFLPEEDQESPDGDYVIMGTPRKNVVH